jgi:hypothetical protein
MDSRQKGHVMRAEYIRWYCLLSRVRKHWETCFRFRTPDLATGKGKVAAGQQPKAIDQPHGVDVRICTVAQTLVADTVGLRQPDLLA